MDRNFIRRLKGVDSSEILAELSTRQYVRPHALLVDVLTQVAAKLGLTLSSVREGANRMEIDTDRAIGRLKRVELENLSRLICRSYRHEFAPASVDA